MRYDGFFDRIKAWSKKQNETIEGLISSATGRKITNDMYQGWRRCKNLPSGEFCYEIAQYMGVSTDWLISGIEKNPLSLKYADVLIDLEDMDALTLENARLMISTLAENCRKKSGAQTVG